jgi:chromosome segregation ATPase
MHIAPIKSVARAATFVTAFAIGFNCFAQSSSEQTTMSDVKDELTDVTKIIGEYSADRKDEAIAKVDDALNKLDAGIDELQSSIEKKSSQMSDSAREKAENSMKALRRQRNEVAEWYGGLKHSSADAWEQVKRGFTESYGTLRDSWSKAKQEFGKAS